MIKIIILLLITSSAITQPPSQTLGKKLIDIGYKAFTENKYDQSISIFEQAINQFKKEKDTTEILHCYNLIFGVLETQTRQKDFLKCEKELNSYINSSNFQTVVIYNCLGAAYRDQLNLDKAKNYFETAIQKTKNYKVVTDEMYYHQGRTFNNISKLYKILGDQQTQIANTKLGINSFLLIKEKYPQDSSEIGNQYLELAEIFMKQNKNEEAIKTLNIAKKFFQKNDFSLLINYHQQIASVFSTNSLYNSNLILSNINKAIELQTKNKITNQIGRSYEVLGEAYLAKADFKNCQIAFDRSLKIRLETQNALAITTAFKNIGKLKNNQNLNLEALQNLQKALQYNSTNFKSDNISQNPKLEALKYKNDLIEIYKEKIIALLAIYKKEGKKEYLEYALSAINSVHELINYQRNSFQLEGSKLFLSEQAHTIYGLAIEAAYQKYVLTNDAKYINLAFQYSEAIKSVVLFESIKANEKSSFNGVPQTLIDIENKAIKNMAIYENQLYKDTKNEDLWRKKLIDVTDQLAKLKAKFKKEYPKYYNYKYNNEPIKIAELQSKLTVNQSVIEYFLVENTLFTFLITKASSKFIKQNLTVDFKSQVAQFRNNLISKSIDESYQKLSFSIYNTLFPTSISQILAKEKTNHVKIVADGVLNQIPFESLLTKKPKSLKETNIYLLEKYVIGYLPSATMNWKQAQTKESTWWLISYLGFAPQYKNGLDLPVNQETVNYLATNLSGESYLLSSATIPNFEKSSKENTKILHLSMHGGASPTDPMESYLAFGTDSLFAHDIYTKSIPTDLAILDACETGVGQINNGEGVLNLARSFLHAGGQSIAMSLWKLTSSAETATIIKDFAKLVMNGSAKDQALTKAKLNYLEKHRNDLVLGHPYYWSPLIVIGNTQPIEPSHFVYWFILISLFCAYCYSSRRKV